MLNLWLCRNLKGLGITFIAVVSTCLSGPATAEGDLIGEAQTYIVQKGDDISSVARHFDIGAIELLAANPAVTSSNLTPGQTLIITQVHILPPTPRNGIVINLAELRLFYYPPDAEVLSFPISIGKEGWLTPTGITLIAQKRKNPTWTPPASIRAENPKLPAVVPAGPNNPLGQFALNLAWPGYAIHGTNAPSSIGKPSSHGCIRMYPQDIALLYNLVDIGTSVTIIDAPVKFGWAGASLYMEVTPTQIQARHLVQFRTPTPIDSTQAKIQLQQFEAQGVIIDWQTATAALEAHSGIPVVVGLRF